MRCPIRAGCGADPGPIGARSAGDPSRFRNVATEGAIIHAAIAIDGIEYRFVVIASTTNAARPSMGPSTIGVRVRRNRRLTPMATASATAASTPDSAAT